MSETLGHKRHKSQPLSVPGPAGLLRLTFVSRSAWGRITARLGPPPGPGPSGGDCIEFVVGRFGPYDRPYEEIPVKFEYSEGDMARATGHANTKTLTDAADRAWRAWGD